jgi:hypothetical protein
MLTTSRLRSIIVCRASNRLRAFHARDAAPRPGVNVLADIVQDKAA